MGILDYLAIWRKFQAWLADKPRITTILLALSALFKRSATVPEKTGYHDEYPPKYDPQKDHPADQVGG